MRGYNTLRELKLRAVGIWGVYKNQKASWGGNVEKQSGKGRSHWAGRDQTMKSLAYLGSNALLL